MVNGNKGRGYNLGLWNCRKGLINGKGEASTKVDEIKQFVYKRNLHMLCVIEADLHSRMSRSKRRTVVTGKDIEVELAIPGYKIYLPATWKCHGQSRIIVFAKDELKVSERPLGHFSQ